MPHSMIVQLTSETEAPIKVSIRVYLKNRACIARVGGAHTREINEGVRPPVSRQTGAGSYDATEKMSQLIIPFAKAKRY